MNYYPINMSQHSLSDVVFFQGELKWNDGTIPIIETGKGDIRICYDYDVDFTDLTEINIHYVAPIVNIVFDFFESWDKGNNWLHHPSNEEIEYFDFIKTECFSFGAVAVWLFGERKSMLITYKKAVVHELPNINSGNIDMHSTRISSASRVRENLERNGLPPRDLFDNYMKQFSYRYQVVFGLWDEEKEEWLSDEKVKQAEEAGSVMPELDYIEEALYDGTHDKLHDGGLMNYHEAGKPKKLAIKWHIKKSEYMAYFWFEDEAIREVFDRFYGAHPETKTDFMIRIDAEQNKYELALYRYGLKEPQVISESAYQLIVFKNKFEYFRSENYDQPRGAWIW